MRLATAQQSRLMTMTYLFELKVKERTTKQPGTYRGRSYFGFVYFQLRKVNHIEFRIDWFETKLEYRGMGQGTDCLGWLCDLADDYQIQLSLRPSDANLVRLTSWYQKFGFIRLGFQNEMIRYPACSSIIANSPK